MPTTKNHDKIRTDRQGQTWLDLPARALRRGMVVRTHGMLLLVTRDARRSQMHGPEHGGCWSADSIVLNPTDPEADDLALRLADRDENGTLHWSLQANSLVTWCVAEPTAPAYTWHPSRDGFGTVLEAEAKGEGNQRGFLIVGHGYKLADAVAEFGKVTEYPEDVPVTVPAR